MANNLTLPDPFSIPVSRLCLVAGAAAVAIGAVAGVLGLTGRIDGTAATAGLIGSWSAIAISLASLLAIAPWKPRTALDWQTLWIASTAMRLVLTPAVLVSVYFAALLPGGALFLGGAAGYGLALLGEALVIVSAVPRNLPQRG